MKECGFDKNCVLLPIIYIETTTTPNVIFSLFTFWGDLNARTLLVVGIHAQEKHKPYLN